MSWRPSPPVPSAASPPHGGVGTDAPAFWSACCVFEILKICLQFLNVNPAYTYIAQGLVIIVAVALDLRKYLAKK